VADQRGGIHFTNWISQAGEIRSQGGKKEEKRSGRKSKPTEKTKGKWGVERLSIQEDLSRLYRATERAGLRKREDKRGGCLIRRRPTQKKAVRKSEQSPEGDSENSVET